MGGYIGSKASVVSSGAERKKHFAITTTTTSLTGLTYTPTMVHVYHNGIRLVDGTDFTATDGSTITLTNAAENGDDVVVVSFATFQTSDTVSKSAGGTFAGNVTHTGDLNVGTIKDETGTNTAITINSSGDVGIKTSSPTRPLSITDQTNDGSGGIILSSYLPTLEMDDISGGGTSFILQHDQTNTLFKHDTTERMRIDSGGNLLVGVTSNSSSVAGVTAGNSGLITATRSSNYSAIFNRLSSAGEVLKIRYAGANAGGLGVTGSHMSIFANTGYVGIAGSATSPDYYAYNLAIYPSVDNLRDIGTSGNRFDDIRATNGTIQTSDEREKQQIASLTDAEITAAKAISKLFKTFKWNDRVAEKGDAARTHTGVVAQQVETAMTDAGLNAGDYAFFIDDTWWEVQTEVPAVEAVDEVLDEYGNVVTEAVEAQEAFTRTDNYYTADEAPEGATERNRKGIRYPELLSFIGAATEQRLASIESRLDALEST